MERTHPAIEEIASTESHRRAMMYTTILATVNTIRTGGLILLQSYSIHEQNGPPYFFEIIDYKGLSALY